MDVWASYHKPCQVRFIFLRSPLSMLTQALTIGTLLQIGALPEDGGVIRDT